MPTPYVPSLRTWALGDFVLVPRLRADVDGAVQLLSQPPLFTGQQANAQPIPNATETPVSIDTETWDNFNGHTPTSNPALYYGMFPGWMLVQCCAPLDYTGGAGTMGAAVAFSSAGGANTYYGGERIPNSPTAGQRAFPVAAKLVQMQNVGSYGGSGNDYLAASVYQDSGASQNLYPGTNRFPYMSAQWVCANSGTAGLPVPPLATVPSPITSAWLNANIRDTVNFLIYPPIFEAQYNAGSQSLASATTLPALGTTLQLDSKVVDNYGAFSTTTHTWTAPVNGTYWAYNLAAMNGASTILSLAAGLTVTSSNYNSGSPVTLWSGTRAAFPGTRTQSAAARRRLRLNAGDTVQAAGWQRDSAAAAATVAGNTNEWQSRLIIIWRSA